MKPSIGTVIPPLLILATLGWVAWPHLDPPTPLAIPKAVPLEVADSTLNPALGSLPTRNPFRLVGDDEETPTPALLPVAAPTKAANGPAAAGKPNTGTTKGAVAPGPSPLEGRMARLRVLAETVMARAEQARRNQVDLSSKLDGKVKLSGTTILGDRRFAILNGRTFAQGEPIDWETGLGGPIFVTEVRPASVVLHSRGARVDVPFPPTSMATAAPPAAPASIAPAGNRARPARQSVRGRAARADPTPAFSAPDRGPQVAVPMPRISDRELPRTEDLLSVLRGLQSRISSP